ncbi:gag-pol, partial [Mucuna pruriens]
MQWLTTRVGLNVNLMQCQSETTSRTSNRCTWIHLHHGSQTCNFIFPPKASRLYKKKIKSDAKYYIWDDPYLWKCGSDQVIRRCIPDSEINSVLHFCHAAAGGGHHGSIRTAWKMPQQPILFCEVFDVWGIDFMRPFPISNGYSYILLVVDYMSRWVEVVATKTNDAKVVVNFLKSNIFCWFGVPKALISD